MNFIQDHLEQGRFSGSVASNQSGFMTGGQGDGSLIEKDAATNAVCEVVNMKHRPGDSMLWPEGKRALK